MLSNTLRGHYNIIRPLAQGGFGQTFLAEDLDLPTNPTCVVKRLHPYPCEDWQLDIAKRLFEKEAEILYKLGVHDRIPRLFAHFQEGNDFYLVQEFIEGNSLDQEINEQTRHSPSQVRQILEDVLEILVFVHDHQVIHRDIKPSNLIRRKHDQRIVLIDFGAVKELTSLALDPQGNTYTSITIGTPGYMPNEQLGGKPRFSSDIYALGMVCIQAFTATAPDDLPEDPYTHEIAWHELLESDQRHPGLLQILDKMVRLDFRQRFQFASDVIQALRHANDHVTLQPTVIPTPTTRDRVTVPLRPTTQLPVDNPKYRRFWLSMTLVSSVIALPIAFLFATYSFNRNNQTNQAIPPINPKIDTPAPEPQKNLTAPAPQTTNTPTNRPSLTKPSPTKSSPPVPITARPAPTVRVPIAPPTPRPVPQTPLQQAETLLFTNQPDRALAVLDRGIQENPQNIEYWRKKIDILDRLSRREQKNVVCEQAQVRFGLEKLAVQCGVPTASPAPITSPPQVTNPPEITSPPQVASPAQIDRETRPEPPLRPRPPRPPRPR